MSARRVLTILGLLALAALLVGGIGALFVLRFEGGDNYPPYSTLRADPLGARVLCESLEGLPGLTTTRNLRPLRHLEEGAGTTLFLLGLSPDEFADFNEDEVRYLESFLIGGGRLVLTLAPQTTNPRESFLKPRSADTATTATRPLTRSADARTSVSVPAAAKVAKAKTSKTSETAESARSLSKAESQERERRRKAEQDDPKARKRPGLVLPIPLTVSLAAMLDLDMGYKEMEKNKDRETFQPIEVACRAAGEALPATLKWRSGVYVKRLGQAWRTLYGRGELPVLIERPYGRGRIVLATDSFFASNEAMRDERQARLLAWLVGPSHRVVFDETHLGVNENQGVMTLALKYRLHGVFAVLLLLAFLFVWKSATRLVPPRPEPEMVADRGQSGRDAWGGLVDLLERNISRESLLRVCFTEWSRGRTVASARQKEVAARLKAMVEEEEALPASARNLVPTYRAMALAASRRAQARRAEGGKGDSGAGRKQNATDKIEN